MRRLIRPLLILLAASATVVTAAASAGASPAPSAVTHSSGSEAIFPTTIALPNGFRPEGFAIDGAFGFSGSLVDGRIARINLVDGQVTVLGHAPGASSTGMKVDAHNRLFVAGGASGQGRVVNPFDGVVLATFQLAAANASFINDVVITSSAAYFTDSVNPVLYKLPLGPGGKLPAANQVVDIPLTGDFVTGPGFNANGISRTPDGRALVIVQTNTGKLFRVDPATGVARTIDLGGESVVNGDGILLSGHTLFVVQNQNNQVASVRLDNDAQRGTVLSRVTDPRFDVPTAVAPFGNRLYLVNARFDVAPTPDTTYTVVAIARPVH